jgi:hypothetical protein
MPQPRVSGLPLVARVFAVVVLVVGFFLILFVSWRNDGAIEDGRTTTAQVVAVNKSSRHPSTGSLVVRFTTADGQTVTTTTMQGTLADPLPVVGSTIPVVYDPTNPRGNVRDPRAPQDSPTPPLLVAGAGVVLVGVLGVALVRRRRTRAADAG